MKEAVILILSILVCYLLWRLFSIKYTLKKAEKELREISAEPEENRIVSFLFRIKRWKHFFVL